MIEKVIVRTNSTHKGVNKTQDQRNEQQGCFHAAYPMYYIHRKKRQCWVSEKEDFFNTELNW